MDPRIACPHCGSLEVIPFQTWSERKCVRCGAVFYHPESIHVKRL